MRDAKKCTDRLDALFLLNIKANDERCESINFKDRKRMIACISEHDLNGHISEALT